MQDQTQNTASGPLSNIRITRANMNSLQQIAAEQGFLVRRGVGTGQIGHPASLLEKVVQAWRQRPTETEILLQQIVSIAEEEQQEKRND